MVVGADDLAITEYSLVDNFCDAGDDDTVRNFVVASTVVASFRFGVVDFILLVWFVVLSNNNCLYCNNCVFLMFMLELPYWCTNKPTNFVACFGTSTWLKGFTKLHPIRRIQSPLFQQSVANLGGHHHHPTVLKAYHQIPSEFFSFLFALVS